MTSPMFTSYMDTIEVLFEYSRMVTGSEEGVCL